ncbi:MAG TPA: hypothetical protein VJV58_12500 [Bradyrhizobium sp.]|nr:hypothetical protein [Bradyrhizobium sp.]HKO71744.1 hypothetical protein [Bradyrhizobium sp.]
MMLADRIQEFLQRLTPLTRSSLLAELERLEMCEGELPGTAEILATLRAEFRKDGSTQDRVNNPSRYFFAPLEPFLVDGAPEHTNFGRIQRGSLAAIWEWISRDLLPTMARDYVKKIDELILANHPREAQKVASAFQTKVAKYLESTLGSAESADQTRRKLATYTASRAAYTDLTKMVLVLREHGALAKLGGALPASIDNFDDGSVAKISALLDGFSKTHAQLLPFALTLVAKRLKTSWQLIRLATKQAGTKNAADIAATPYAISVSMVLDRLEDNRSALRIALKSNRILVSKEILKHIYDTEYALQVRIDQLEQSEWGLRLNELMHSIGVLVEQEVARFPDNVGHVLGSRRLRSHDSLSGRLTYLAWKGRDVVSGGAAFCRKLIGQT